LKFCQNASSSLPSKANPPDSRKDFRLFALLNNCLIVEVSGGAVNIVVRYLTKGIGHHTPRLPCTTFPPPPFIYSPPPHAPRVKRVPKEPVDWLTSAFLLCYSLFHWISSETPLFPPDPPHIQTKRGRQSLRRSFSVFLLLRVCQTPCTPGCSIEHSEPVRP